MALVETFYDEKCPTCGGKLELLDYDIIDEIDIPEVQRDLLTGEFIITKHYVAVFHCYCPNCETDMEIEGGLSKTSSYTDANDPHVKQALARQVQI